MKKITRYGAFFWAMISAGAGLVAYGLVEPYHEMPIALGVAFITSGSVGVIMMLMTDRVAEGLHVRFNEQTGILKEIVVIQKGIASTQKEMASSQKEMASSQKEMASSQKENHSEMISTQKEIISTQKEMISTQKEMASTQKEMASSQKENHREMMQILKKIDHSLENLEQKS